MKPIAEAANTIRMKAAELRAIIGPAPSVHALDWAAEVVETAVTREMDELLTVREAATLSGYSPDHISRLIRNGQLPNAGRRYSPRIRRRDLPLKATRVAVVTDVAHIGSASATQVARSLAQRGRS